MESVRHAAWKSHSSDGLALEVGRLDDYQFAAVPDRVVHTDQIPAGEFARPHGNAVPRGHTDQPIVDARELYGALVDLLCCNGATGQIDRSVPHHGVESRLAIVAP